MVDLTARLSSNNNIIASKVQIATGGNAILGLGALTDVTITNPADGSYLIYQNSSNTFIDDSTIVKTSSGITLTGGLVAGSLDISGDVDVDGTLETDALTIAGVTLAETISDTVGAMVTNNSTGGIAVTYQDSDNTIDFDVSDFSITLTGDVTGSGTVTNLGNLSFATTVQSGSIENGMLDNNTITVSDGSNTSPVALGGTLTFAGTSNEVTVAENAGTITVGLPDDVTITGDLSVADAPTAGAHVTNKTYVDGKVSALVDSAPATLDTLNELAAALGDDASYATTTATSLGNRLRIDVNNQSLTATQKSNASTNLGLGTAATTAATAYAPSAGSTSINTVGTIGTGTWQGTAIANDYIGNHSAAKLTSGTIPNARLPAAATSITSVGTLSGLTTGATVVNGALTVNNDLASIVSTDAGAAAAPVFELYRNSASPADEDLVGQIQFQGENDADEKYLYASISGKIHDATNSSENGKLEFNVGISGSMQTIATIDQASGFDTGSYAIRGSYFVIGSDSIYSPNNIINGGLTINNFNSADNLELVDTDSNNTTSDPRLSFYRDSSSPADNDHAGRIGFYANNDADQKTNTAGILHRILDVSDGTEDGELAFSVMKAGTSSTLLTLNPDGVTVDGELTVNADTLKLTSTAAASTTENPSIELFRNGGAGAAGSELGAIKFFGTNNASTPEKIEYAGIYAETEYHVDGSEQGNIKFKLSHGGAQEDPVMSLFSYGMQMGYGNPILMSYSNGYQQFFSENAVQKSFKFQAFPNATVANGAYNIYLPDVAGGTLAVIDSDKAFTAGATTVNGALTVNSDLLEITSTVDDATEKPIISLYRDAGVPSPNDELGAIRWFGQNASDEKQFYGGIYAQADVITDGAHKGSLNFHLADGSNNGTAISDVLVDINGDEDPTMNLTAELLTLNAGLIVNNDFMEVVSTTDSANDMPILSLYRDAGATTNGDEIGGVRFFGNNASDEKTFYCGMYAEIKEGDDGGEIGELMFHVADNSGNTSAVTDVTANIVGDTDPAMSLLYYQLNLRSDVNLNFQYGAGNYNYVNWDTGSNNTKLVADYSDDANITCTLPVATCTLSGEGLNQSSYRSGEIIETLRGYADGRTLTGQATTAGAARNVALEDVTAEQILSNSYAKVNGTEFDYYPPAGTKTVLVEYQIFIGYDGSDIDPVFHHKIDVDGTVITQTQSTTRQEYRGHVYSVSEAIITVDGSGDLASGNIDSWNAAKTFRVLGREFGASNNVALHRVRIHDGSASATIINEPKIKITAIG